MVISKTPPAFSPLAVKLDIPREIYSFVSDDEMRNALVRMYLEQVKKVGPGPRHD